MPTVVGPKKHHYAVDHHHFTMALIGEEAPLLGIYVLADLSHLPKDEFWTFMDNSDWCHAYDEKGERRELTKIPKNFGKLEADPYRSLVGSLIRAGGCAKSNKPFAEFLWADYFRRRIDRGRAEHQFSEALGDALALARQQDVKSLSGWCPAPQAS